MPTVSVGRDRLFAALGKSYTKEELKNKEVSERAQREFEDECFRFGIELDDVTTEKAIIRKEKHLDQEDSDEDEEVIYKIDIPANRYDLLCIEGLSQALRIFEKKQEVPQYKLADISKGSMLRMHVAPETSRIRPHVVCAVLRGITFTEASYNSFIDLQDKLHHNICRRRTLVAIGTHDLDTVQAPFSYEALPPSSISFVPLKQEKNFRADDLMEFYKSDLKLKKFLHIIENSEVYPVIYDKNRTVLSLPPIINGAHSAITLKTKNVFVECTATDLTKAKIVLNTIVTAFSSYCEKKFDIEPVEVIYPDGKSYVYPDLSVYNMDVSLSYINGRIGLSLGADEVIDLLKKMQLGAQQSVSGNNQDNITVLVPPTRSDVLHPCDVVEDVAIAYGYNNLPPTTPASSPGTLKPDVLNEFSDMFRYEIAMNGYTEVLNFILGSWKDNFELLRCKDDKSKAVVVGNPRSSDFELVRTTLMPGILKAVGHNKDHPKPIKVFEVGDVVILDETEDVGATNQRQLAALYCGATSGFELIHGLVDRIMEVLKAALVPPGYPANKDTASYYLQRAEEPEFLLSLQGSIYYREKQTETSGKGKKFGTSGKWKQIGTFGLVHPEVLRNFDIPDPCSYVEINVESLL